MAMAPDAMSQAMQTNPGSPSPGSGLGQPNAGMTIPMPLPAVGKHRGTAHRKGRHGRSGKKHGR